MKLNTLLKLPLVLLFLLVSCKGHNVKQSNLSHQINGVVFDEDAQELLVDTKAGVMRYGVDGELINGPREALRSRFTETKERIRMDQATKSPASISELAHTPYGVVSYDEVARNLYLMNPGSYPRLIISNIERPSDIVFSKISGRLFFALNESQSMLTLYLRPAL